MSTHALSHPRVLSLLTVLCFSAALLAQSDEPSAFELLKPGVDSNLAWVDLDDAREKAAEAQKPVMIYFFEGEKTNKNAQNMIRAQNRLFPDEDVIKASEHFVCVKVDRQAGSGKDDDDKPTRRRREDRLREEREAKEGKEEQAEGTGPILAKQDWPTEVALVFLDYQGRPLSKPLTKIPTSGRKFAKTMAGMVRGNLKRVAIDEKEAKKAAEKAERERKKAEEEEAKRRAEEEKKAEEEKDGEEE